MHLGSTHTAKRRARTLASALTQTIEQLEQRRFLTVTTVDNQWTVFAQDTTHGRKIFVDNGVDEEGALRGSDSYDGLSAEWTGQNHGPKRSISAAKSLVSDASNDWLLLRRGDSWNEAIGSWFSKSGRSKNDPIVIGSYGFFDSSDGPVYYDPSNFPNPQGLNLEPRPIINSGNSDGLSFTGGSSRIAVVGLEFFANGYNGSNSNAVAGVRAQTTGSDYLVEDVKVRAYKDDVAVGNPNTPVDGFIIRRSQVLDAYNTMDRESVHAQGLYASGSTKNLTIEENTFDHNGWRINTPTDKTVYNHDMYINTGAQNITVQRNVITRGSLRGTLLRSGGAVLNNFYAQNAVAIQVGNSESRVEGNVIIQGVDLPSLASGVGIDVAFSIPKVTITDNVIAHDSSAYVYNLSGINLNGGTNNATVTGNTVYDWRRTFINGASGGTNTVTGNTFEDFDTYHPVIKESGGGTTQYGGNSYYSGDASRMFQDGSNRENFSDWKSGHSSDNSSSVQLKSYLDPNRDMATYSKLVAGVQSFDTWINNQRNQSRENFSTAYTAAAEISYIRAGFNLDTSNPPPVPLQVVNVSSAPPDGDPFASEINLDPGKFVLTRTGNATQIFAPLTIEFDAGGSATRGSDYTLSRSVVTFPGGVVGATSESLVVTVNPLADAFVEGDETVKFKILAPATITSQYVTGTSPSATVTISDSTVAVSVQAPISETSEITPELPGEFTLTRSGPTTAALTVNVEISGSATHPLFASPPDNLADYSLTGIPDAHIYIEPATATTPARNHILGTVTFPVGASSVNVDVTAVDDQVPEGLDGAPGDENVGLSLSTFTPLVGYVKGSSSGATVTILDAGAVAPPPSDGGGGDTDPPPLGHGLYEQFVNAPDSFVPAPTFLSGTVVFDQADNRPGFSFTGKPHPEVNADKFSTLWIGQFQPQYGETYTLSLSLDGDASAKLYLQDDTGTWRLITSTNDTDPSKTNYASSDYFVHRLGDADDDSHVDIADFTALSTHFGQATNKWAEGDFNADGTVNALDFNALAANFGTADPRPTTHEISGQANFLEAGVKYNIAIEYSDKVGSAKMRFLWSSKSRPKQEVPLDRLYYLTTGAGGDVPAPLPSALPSAAPSLFSNTSVSDGSSNGASDPDVLG